ncbi:hypothetical protein QYF36_003674 [Acer negundo]|nr:hypothetical protein QYF36_003674 [Acer negundo]
MNTGVVPPPQMFALGALSSGVESTYVEHARGGTRGHMKPRSPLQEGGSKSQILVASHVGSGTQWDLAVVSTVSTPLPVMGLEATLMSERGSGSRIPVA